MKWSKQGEEVTVEGAREVGIIFLKYFLVDAEIE
jgi:hypothetical protein